MKNLASEFLNEFKKKYGYSFSSDDEMKQKIEEFTKEWNEKQCKIQKVNCSYCGHEMECPDNMLDVNRHVCYICSDILASGVKEDEVKDIADMEYEIDKHKVDANKLAEAIHSVTFRSNIPPKEFLKEMSKKEIADEMYFSGIYTTLDFFLHAGMVGEDVKKLLEIIEKSKEHLEAIKKSKRIEKAD